MNLASSNEVREKIRQVLKLRGLKYEVRLPNRRSIRVERVMSEQSSQNLRAPLQGAVRSRQPLHLNDAARNGKKCKAQAGAFGQNLSGAAFLGKQLRALA